jgi:hypothetical protein
MLLWDKENVPYIQASMGFTNGSDFSWISYKNKGWNAPHGVSYIESHDEERMMYKNVTWGNSSGDYRIKDTTTALKRTELAALFFFTVPGPKMIWQFGELGYDYSINFNGRLGEKPVRWDYYSDWRRNYLYHFFSTLIDLKKEQPIFKSENFSLSVAGTLKRINITGSPMYLSIIGNFGVVEGSIDPNFLHPGTWYEYFTRDSIAVSDMHAPITLQAGEYRLYTDYKLTKPDLNTGIEDNNDCRPPTADCRLMEVYPNPAIEGVNFDIRIDESSDIRLEIFDVMGKRVKLISDEKGVNGDQHIYWNRTMDEGHKVPGGVYFYRLIVNQKLETGTIIFAY